MAEYHEKWDALPTEVRDMHRALKSLQEELEAVDWYQQRLAVAEDDELRDILAHNRDEEIEHAAMVLEWLRRRSARWDDELRTYLFTTIPIVEAEDAGSEAGDGSLGLGALDHDKEDA